MSGIDNKELKKFYHGEVNDNERTLIEEYLFTSSIGLMEYFAIKRDEEVDIPYLKRPSSAVREKLQHSLPRTKRVVVPLRSRKSWLATACGLALIGGIYLWQSEQLDTTEISPDSFKSSVDTALDVSSGTSFL